MTQERVLIYSGTARAFRTTLVGYLYELAQHWPTVLLCEELDDRTSALLADPAYFPKLQQLVPVGQFATPRPSWLKQNARMRKAARTAIDEFRPTIVVAPSDNDTVFELYLMRYAKQSGALRLSISCVLTDPDVQATRTYVDYMNVQLRTPRWLPYMIRLTLVKIRKYAAHAVIYWLLPLLQGELPFWGLTSYILHRGHSGMRDASLQIVMHRRDEETYLARGVPKERLVRLTHPLRRSARKCYECLFDLSIERRSAERVALFLLPDNEYTLGASDMVRVGRETVFERRFELLKIASREMNGWRLIVKPHPSCKSVAQFAHYCGEYGLEVEFLRPEDSLESWFSRVDMILELPRPGSMALYFAALCNTGAPILALNCYDEFYGGYYRDFPDIIYVTTLEEYRGILASECQRSRELRRSGNVAGPIADDDFAGLYDLVQCHRTRATSDAPTLRNAVGE